MKVGKLSDFKTSFPEFVRSVYLSGYEMLSIKDEHFEAYSKLDFNDAHRDPFDRYLLASAYYENFAIISIDEKFRFYRKTSEIVW